MHAGDLGHDAVDLARDFRQLFERLASNTNTTVTTDLTTIRTDLGKIVTDFLAGNSLTADVTTLTADVKTLVTDLGTTASHSVQHTLKDITNDLTDVAADMSSTASTGSGGKSKEEDHENESAEDHEHEDHNSKADALADLNAAQKHITQLTNDLGSTITPTVTMDIATLQADVTAIIGDVKAGTDPTADINKALNDGQTLFADLGATLTPAVERDVLKITADGADVTVDLATTPPSPKTLLNNAQNDLNTLSTTLGSGVSSTVSTDLNVLQADLSSIAADMLAGRNLTRDVRLAIRDETQLFHDLNGMLAPKVTNTLVDLAFNLFELPARHSD
jgi:hypothetical protein